MNESYPVPPPELVQQWAKSDGDELFDDFYLRLATQAARWGADTELEACCEWVEANAPGYWDAHKALRIARRPKPPSLKKQALALLGKKDAPVMLGTPEYRLSESEADTIRRALEALDD